MAVRVHVICTTIVGATSRELSITLTIFKVNSTTKIILDLGFDAIWISPIVDNYDSGYHGYWARKWYSINSHFGTSDDLKRLIVECHKRDIWVMVDIVANHVNI